MCHLEFLAIKPGHVAVGIQLVHPLMRYNEPVVAGSYRSPRFFRGFPGSPLARLIVDIPCVGRRFSLFPHPFIVIPLVSSTHLHSGIALAPIGLEAVILFGLFLSRSEEHTSEL